MIRTYADLTFLFLSEVYDLFQLLCVVSSVFIRAKRISNCYIQKKNLCVCSNLGFSGEKICACVRLILVLVWGTYYVPDTYVPHFMIPGTYYVPDTYDTRYVLCTRYV